MRATKIFPPDIISQSSWKLRTKTGSARLSGELGIIIYLQIIDVDSLVTHTRSVIGRLNNRLMGVRGVNQCHKDGYNDTTRTVIYFCGA